MCDQENKLKPNFVKQTSKNSGNLTVQNLNALEIFTQTITTQKILLDGIALNSLMLQKLLSHKNSAGSGATDPLLLQTINEINQNLLSLNQNVTVLSTKTNDYSAFIEFLKTQITIYN